MNSRLWLVLLAVLLFCPLAGQSTPNSARLDSLMDHPPAELAPAGTKPPGAVKPSTAVSETKSQIKLSELHRLDFRLVGKSCPVCLLSIQNKIKSLIGVQDAAVMLRRPFGVSVIYDAGKASSNSILTTIKAKEPVIKIFEISDKKVDSLPVPLIPPFVPTVEPIINPPDNAMKPMDGKL